ncbi:MAG: tetratricopeptide repeat protein [Verrucomicrobiota bacterium]|nr:tetratricopeptide repeat protein [Verrucomicrobiota bacterium]
MRGTLPAIATGLIFLSGASLAAEDFDWSWQKEEKTISDETGGAAAIGPTGGAVRAEVAVPAEAAPAAATAAGIDPAAYAKLLEENQSLRNKIMTVENEKELIEQNNAKLIQEIGGMEQRLAGMTALLAQFNEEKAVASGNADRIAELEAHAAEAEKEKARLAEELASLKARQREAPASATAPAAGAEKATEPAARVAAVKRGSDLFRDLERQNAELRARLANLESERQKAVKTRDGTLKKSADAEKQMKRAESEKQKLEEKLAGCRAAEKEHKDLIARLTRRITPMEKEIADLKASLSGKADAAASTGVEVETLKIEIEKREDRLRKTERMAALLEQARDKVKRASDTEKRDMHYNMAVIYAREGRVEEAEREYLNALRIDPNDADAHFNLGILYEEAKADKNRAIQHYKKHLKLNPYGPDADKIKSWLLQLEME